MALERGPLLVEGGLRGRRWCRRYTDLVDDWIADLLAQATFGDAERIALVAVGGYGRRELCPGSDIDVYLVHARGDVGAIADRIWYPIWDEDLLLGHNVCTVKEALRLASDDLETATALLSARHVAGDPSLSTALATRAADTWDGRSKRWLSELGASVALRHQRFGEVAFSLEPDLKEGRGGLRDVHALQWAQETHRVTLDLDHATISTAYAALLEARVELHRRTGRASNVLALQDQDDVAAALGDPDADALMARVAEAARTIAWTSDDTWRRVRSALRGPLGRVGRRNRPIEDGVHLRDGEVRVGETEASTDPLIGLRAAVAAAEHHTVIERGSLERLARTARCLPSPWPPAGRELFVRLLGVGAPAVQVVEALDQRGVWASILPEWDAVRCRPQRNPYHRYTVDRHLLEAAAQAALLAPRVRRPDLLLVGALLHDIGKGHPGDHSLVGTALAGTIATRMGFEHDDVGSIVAMVEHHLLLADVATRRDIDDPATVERVAGLVGSVDRLALLACLTEADGLATGPAAWGPWKAELVSQLVARVSQALGGDAPDLGERPAFPDPELVTRLRGGEDLIEAHGDTLTVMTSDRPGVFSRVAGVLALHGLDVLSAAAHSTDDGRALSQFRVHDGPGREWDRVTRDLALSLEGRLALGARLAERARTYHRHGHHRPPATRARVSFDVAASAEATVIDVQTDDGVGVLFRITRALADLDVDIRSARVQTLGTSVVDAFYVQDRTGAKITDDRFLGEIERAVLHALEGG